MMKLVSMKLDAESRKEKQTASVLADAPQYPYGLSINLDEEAMQKLGMSKMPMVGKPVMITAMADVTGCSENEYTSSDGKTEKRQSCTLQITDLGLAGMEDMTSTADKLYKG